ncbi:MAG TPA: sulfite exporter TauE/SafE family protein [Candidatus Woesebacteria bacterium]|nr:sulfite exporter TauE/SafE family protein [Candidatus Woesebacteria bacterium]
MSQKQTCTFYVSGMHCAACEILIEKKLAKTSGVTSVKASLAHKQVEVTTHQKINLERLNQELSEHGYALSEKLVGENHVTMQSVITGIGISIILFVAYLIIEDVQILSTFTLHENSGILVFFVWGVVASLSTCAALVGGLLLSLSKQWNELYGSNNERQRVIPFAMFNIGRLISYALLGGLLGLVGSFFTVSLQQTAILVILVSLFMLVIGLQMLGVSWAKKIQFTIPKFISKYISNEQNFQGKYMPFLTGALTFFIPCGFTLMAQTIALTTGNIVTSSVMMFSFALGTLPVLAILSFSSLKFQNHSAFAGVFNLLVGFFIIAFSLYNINSQFNVMGFPSLSDIALTPNTSFVNKKLGVQLRTNGKEEYQEVTMEANGFEYFPKEMTLKSGLPAKFTIKNLNVFGCAKAMYMPGLYSEVIYLNEDETKVEFTPEKAGTYKISCSMGMVAPVTVTVM